MNETISSDPIALGLTTVTKSPAVPGPQGFKTFWAEIAGVGEVAAVINIYGTRTTDTSPTKRVLLGRIELTGTTEIPDAVASATGDYPFLHAEIESISGTGATVNVYVFH